MPHWVHAPFPTRHEQEDFLRLLWAGRPILPPPEIHQLLRAQDGIMLYFFTDGSCTNPGCPPARHAAWSVILYNSAGAPSDLRAVLDSPAACRAAFPVVAQGLIPGVQTIYRAEAAALLQVVALALRYPTYNFTAWSDSASALKSIQTWLDDISVDGGLGELEDLRCFPLGQRPNNLLLRKVQAHTELASLPNSSLMPAIGNWVADIAAKAAEANDLLCIKETATDIVHWRHLQSENLFMFCQYLIEVTKAVAELKRVHQHRRDEICLESSCDPTDCMGTVATQSGRLHVCGLALAFAPRQKAIPMADLALAKPSGLVPPLAVAGTFRGMACDLRSYFSRAARELRGLLRAIAPGPTPRSSTKGVCRSTDG